MTLSLLLRVGRPVRQTYRRANTSINLGGVVDSSSDLFRSCSNILDKFGAKPTRDNLAVLNGSAGVTSGLAGGTSGSASSSASLKEFLLGRSKEPAPYPPDLPLKVSTEFVYSNFYGAQESISKNRFRQPI
jgi:hypothetical protein